MNLPDDLAEAMQRRANPVFWVGFAILVGIISWLVWELIEPLEARC